MTIDDIHTCHSECQRPICVAVREAVAAEREACAQICEKDFSGHGWAQAAIAAQAIRERGAP